MRKNKQNSTTTVIGDNNKIENNEKSKNTMSKTTKLSLWIGIPSAIAGAGGLSAGLGVPLAMAKNQIWALETKVDNILSLPIKWIKADIKALIEKLSDTENHYPHNLAISDLKRIDEQLTEIKKKYSANELKEINELIKKAREKVKVKK